LIPPLNLNLLPDLPPEGLRAFYLNGFAAFEGFVAFVTPPCRRVTGE
jgi:hypothetical protein